MQNRFTNPADNSHYDWPQNHTDEEGMGKARNITRAANTGNTGAVKQQGDDGPLVVSLSGKIQHRAQLQAFWLWFNLCKTQTIYFRDFDSQEYEVQIVSFVPKRIRKLSFSGKDPSMPYHYYEYTMTMEVYGVRAGDLAATGVTP
jgi:hypothetical protein